MKKAYIIEFIILTVIAAAGIFAVSYDLAKLNYGSGKVDNRQYKIMTAEADELSARPYAGYENNAEHEIGGEYEGTDNHGGTDNYESADNYEGAGRHESNTAVQENADLTEACAYCLKAERGYVVIFRGDGKFYDYTDIKLSKLPKKIQIAVLNTMRLTSQKALYEFLESYST